MYKVNNSTRVAVSSFSDNKGSSTKSALSGRPIRINISSLPTIEQMKEIVGKKKN